VGLVSERGQLVERVEALAGPVRARVIHRSPFSSPLRWPGSLAPGNPARRHDRTVTAAVWCAPSRLHLTAPGGPE
jgi:hypothetical protein